MSIQWGMPDGTINQNVMRKRRFLTCYRMRKSVTPRSGDWADETVTLHGANGSRKYLNRAERQRALNAMMKLDRSQGLFARLLAWSGARVSEVLALSANSFQLDSGIVSFVTLKRRKFTVREVPIPPQLMADLNREFGIRRLQADRSQARQRLWPFCRMTAWRIIKRVMELANVHGQQACPKGLRHSFGVCSLHAGVPITLVQRWMGHARLSTTAIYLSVCGPEEIELATRFWNAGRETAVGLGTTL